MRANVRLVDDMCVLTLAASSRRPEDTSFTRLSVMYCLCTQLVLPGSCALVSPHRTHYCTCRLLLQINVVRCSVRGLGDHCWLSTLCLSDIRFKP